MEKRYKRRDKTYISKKILGQLYDEVERIDFKPSYTTSFDQRILDAYKIDEEHVIAARQLKLDYDIALRRIMAQHDIKTEFEVWSTFVMSHNDPRYTANNAVAATHIVIATTALRCCRRMRASEASVSVP